MLKYLIYTSKATTSMATSELDQLLNESRTWNSTHDITGMLLYIKENFLGANQGRFIQVIEGNETDINFIFEKIRSDRRHQQITVLNESGIDKRNFTEWSMGFKSLTLAECEPVPGFFELNSKGLKQKGGPKFNAPLTMLRSFYQMHANSTVS